ELRLKSRRDAVLGERGADKPGGEEVIGSDDPRQIRVHAEQHRDTIQVQQKREDDAENRVEAEERREAKEHAQRECGRRSLGRIVDVKQRVEPPANKRAGKVNHRKWLYPRGHGLSPSTWRRRIARSAVHEPIRVVATPAERRTAARR